MNPRVLYRAATYATDARATADSVITALSPAAWYRNGTDVISSGGFASIWADYASSDVGLVLPGVIGNNATAPNIAAYQITGDIDIACRCVATDWTPALDGNFLGAIHALSFLGYRLTVDGTTGKLLLMWGNGSALVSKTSSVATGLTDGESAWVRGTLDVDNGSGAYEVKFYTAPDSETYPTSWTQLGTTMTGASTTSIAATTTSLGVGFDGPSGGGQRFIGTIYRAIVKDGIDGTTVFDADFSAQSIGAASFTESSSNAATVTINASGALPAHIGKARDFLQGTGTNQPGYTSATGAVSYDGTDNFMETLAVSSMVQPLTRISVVTQDTWTLNDYLYDGRAANSGAVYQSATTPDLVGNAGTAMTANGDAPVGTKVILVSQFNGASSFTRVNNNANVASDAGAGNPLGLSQGASGTPGGYGDATFYEEVVFESALSEANINAVVTALANAHGVTL